MRLKVLKTGRYGTRALRAGDIFSADPAYGRIWKVLKMAEDAPAVAAPVVKGRDSADEPKKRGRKPKAVEVEVATAGVTAPNVTREASGLPELPGTIGVVTSEVKEDDID